VATTRRRLLIVSHVAASANEALRLRPAVVGAGCRLDSSAAPGHLAGRRPSVRGRQYAVVSTRSSVRTLCELPVNRQPAVAIDRRPATGGREWVALLRSQVRTHIQIGARLPRTISQSCASPRARDSRRAQAVVELLEYVYVTGLEARDPCPRVARGGAALLVRGASRSGRFSFGALLVRGASRSGRFSFGALLERAGSRHVDLGESMRDGGRAASNPKSLAPQTRAPATPALAARLCPETCAPWPSFRRR
jgi:hypothetical protein